MSILPALQSAAIRLYGRRPTVFFGSSDKFELELCDWANEVAKDIAQKHEWQALVRVEEFSGNGYVTEYPFPTDYDRQLMRSDLQAGNGWAFNYYRIADINDYYAYRQDGIAGWPGIWTIYDDKLHVFPAPATGSRAYYPYISKNYAKDVDGVRKAEFTNDTDSFILPERLLTLGIVWRWRENKKLDYTADLEAFNEALSMYASKDNGSRIIRRNSGMVIPNTYPAWPWELGPKNLTP